MKLRAAVGCLLVSACSSSTEPSTASDAGGVTTGSPSTGPSVTDGGSAGSPAADASPSPGPARDAGAPVGSCDASACASLVGFVQRTSTKPQHGGKGPVYVAVFEGNPITDASHATVVARSLIASADLSADGAQVAYRVDGVPARTAPYQVVAFLDDADAVTASNPQPASGDLISLHIAGAIEGVPVTLASSGDTSLDLPLNAAMP